MRYQISGALLTVRGLLHKNYQPYADLLAGDYQPAADWLNRELLPTLILLPAFVQNDDEAIKKACELALAMELSFLAGRVHDLTAEQQEAAGQTDLPAASRAILVGDYLYTVAAVKLAQAGYNHWLARIGRTICRRSEAKLTRLRWPARPYVPEAEKVANLHKEYAEGFALAAEMSASKLGWPDIERQKWIDFGFYVGLAQGILLSGSGTAACSETLAKAERIAMDLPPALCSVAKETILSQPCFQNYQCNGWQSEYKSQTNIIK